MWGSSEQSSLVPNRIGNVLFVSLAGLPQTQEYNGVVVLNAAVFAVSPWLGYS